MDKPSQPVSGLPVPRMTAIVVGKISGRVKIRKPRKSREPRPAPSGESPDLRTPCEPCEPREFEAVQ